MAGQQCCPQLNGDYATCCDNVPLGMRAGTEAPTYAFDHPDQVEASWLEGIKRVGVTAGASAPENLVGLILERLRELGVEEVREEEGEPEGVVFQMPAGLE